MSGKLEIEGAEAFEALARAMRKTEVGKPLRKELLKQLRSAGESTTADMRTSLRRKLPARGGAAKRLTRKKKTFAVRNRLTSSAKEAAGIRIRSDESSDYRALEERGVLRHPKWPGNRPRASWRWEPQKVPTRGVLEGAVRRNEDTFRTGVVVAVVAAAEAIERELERGT